MNNIENIFQKKIFNTLSNLERQEFKAIFVIQLVLILGYN